MAHTAAARPRAAALAAWCAALVVVPLGLAAVGLAWPGAAIGADIGGRAREALAGAHLTGVTARVDGRDVVLDGVAAGSQAAALAAVADLPGVGTVRVGTLAVPDTGAPAPGPAAPGAAPDAAAKDRLAADLAAAVAAAPITFPADSAALSAGPAATVARVADLLRVAPGTGVTLTGYCADTPGPPPVAQALSERRAAVVADALAAAGVDRARLTTAGRGSADPLDTPAASRRVEITVR